MNERTKDVLLVALLVIVAFLLGNAWSGSRSRLSAEPIPGRLRATGSSPNAVLPAATKLLLPQGRRSRRSRRVGGVKTGVKTGVKGDDPLFLEGSSVTSGQANGVIAVTGSYGIGTSVLYVLDTKSQQLAVYEARGGSQNSRRVFLVGARRVDLDLQLEGYNDESEFTYGELRKRFNKAAAKGTTTEGAKSEGASSGKSSLRK